VVDVVVVVLVNVAVNVVVVVEVDVEAAVKVLGFSVVDEPEVLIVVFVETVRLETCVFNAN
jgi:hypothetical protein